MKYSKGLETPETFCGEVKKVKEKKTYIVAPVNKYYDSHEDFYLSLG